MQAVRYELACGVIAEQVYRRSQKAGALGRVRRRVVLEVVAEWQWQWYAGAAVLAVDVEVSLSGTDVRRRRQG
jgi:hypothetical protein